jgi:hypothetical protein
MTIPVQRNCRLKCTIICCHNTLRSMSRRDYSKMQTTSWTDVTINYIVNGPLDGLLDADSIFDKGDGNNDMDSEMSYDDEINTIAPEYFVLNMSFEFDDSVNGIAQGEDEEVLRNNNAPPATLFQRANSIMDRRGDVDIVNTAEDQDFIFQGNEIILVEDHEINDGPFNNPTNEDISIVDNQGDAGVNRSNADVVIVINDQDFVLRRGGHATHRPGNQLVLTQRDLLRERYQFARNNAERRRIQDELIASVHNREGRFIEILPNGLRRHVTDTVRLRKIAQQKLSEGRNRN